MGKSKIVLKKDLNGNIVEEFPNGRAVFSQDSTITRDTFYKAVKNGTPINGFIYEYSGEFSDDKKGYENGLKCPYCDETMKNYNGLAKHIMHSHPSITKEQLLTDVYYNGERPLCKCGCGSYTNIIYDRNDNNQIKFADYCKGHQSRVHNNWGHNETAKLKSAQTRREQFKSGERMIWNKGKKWSDLYSIEEIDALKDSIYTEERSEKIRQKLINVPKSPEHAQKIRERMASEETREFYRQKMHERIANQKFRISSQLELDFIEGFIKPLGLEYETQYYLNDIHQYCDVYIPSLNTVIECDGSFWHCDKRAFPNGPKYDYQKRKIALDEIKNEYCKTHGIKCLRIWEYDILNNPKKVRELLESELKPQS